MDDHRVDEALDQVGLATAGGRRVRDYSLGMRQRLGVASAILADPPVLICDEPTNGLDPEGIRWLRGLLQDLAAAGHTVLVSSHLLAEMQQLVDSVVIIHRGRLVHEGDIRQVGSDEVRVCSADPAGLQAAVHRAVGDDVRVERTGEETLIVRGVDATRIGLIAQDTGIPLRQLVTEANTLERLFFSLTEPDGSAAVEDPAHEGATR